ncbi:MAG TPA: MBL fold metallo-hydrolase [Syntrophomonadaceae bacterium]|nr:MBL fold metallo-hydrolase [Syntrophomonadaceae bacterium]
MVIDLNKEIKVIRPEALAVFPYSNSLFIDDDIRVMIDAGAGGRAYKPIEPKSVDIVLLTHNHFDHINGVSFFQNAQILAGQEEAEGYTNPEVYAVWAGFKQWEKLMGRAKMERFAESIPMPEDVPVKPGFNRIELAGVIKDNDVFDLGKTRVHALHTPGHSHGHYAFYMEKEGVLFSGDIDIAPRGPWYGGELSDFDDLVKSVEKIIELDPRILVTSHRRIFYGKDENIAEIIRDYINIPLEKENRILDFLVKPQTVNDIAQQDFAKDYPQKTSHAEFWTKMMITKHLDRLLRQDKIVKLDKAYYVQA